MKRKKGKGNAEDLMEPNKLDVLPLQETHINQTKVDYGSNNEHVTH